MTVSPKWARLPRRPHLETPLARCFDALEVAASVADDDPFKRLLCSEVSAHRSEIGRAVKLLIAHSSYGGNYYRRVLARQAEHLFF